MNLASITFPSTRSVLFLVYESRPQNRPSHHPSTPSRSRSPASHHDLSPCHDVNFLIQHPPAPSFDISALRNGASIMTHLDSSSRAQIHRHTSLSSNAQTGKGQPGRESWHRWAEPGFWARGDCIRREGRGITRLRGSDVDRRKRV
jgi:hypothetical protein